MLCGLGQLLSLSVLQFPHLQSGDNISHFIRVVMCAKGFISTVPDMLQPSLLNGVDLLVESAGSEGMGAGEKRRGSQEYLSFLLYNPRGVSGPLAGQAEPIPPNLLQACSFFSQAAACFSLPSTFFPWNIPIGLSKGRV